MRALVAVGLIVLVPACGDDPEVPEPLPASCTAAWQPVTPPLPLDITSGVAYGDGVLYYSAFSAQQTRALSVSSGQETVLAPVFASVIWLEGDHLLLTGGGSGIQYFSLPLTGGTPVLVTDGQVGRSELGIGQIPSHIVTPTDFFWAESSGAGLREPTTVWRAPRNGAPPAELARFSELSVETNTAHYFNGAALAPEGLVLGTNWGIGKVVPLDGTPARSLAVPDVDSLIGQTSFLGVDAKGVYWSLKTAIDSQPDRPPQMAVSPVDGGAVRPIWSTLPPFSSLLGAWSDGEGGLVVTGSQTFAGERDARLTVWWLDPAGNAQRLACATPDIRRHSATFQERPAVAPDAFFFIFWGENDLMHIVRVPRPAAATDLTLD
jgi:hypothetical protein